MFRDAVAAFAEEEVRPRVHGDGAGRRSIDPDLIPKYFELGLMGIEVPEEYGGAGGSLFMVTLAVEEISKIDASAAIMLDVQNTLVNYPIVSVRHRRRRSRGTSRASRPTPSAPTRSPSPARARTPSAWRRAPTKRGDRWILNGRKMWITNGAEAGIFVVFANANPSAGLQGDHGVHRRARLSRASPSARRRTSSASAPRARPS